MKKLVNRTRHLALRGAAVVDHLWRRSTDPLLPPAPLRLYYYRSLSPAVFAHMCDVASTELLSRGLRPDHRVLDVGSGIGNLAIGLKDYLRGEYDGVEINADAVAWCQHAITPRYPAFRFHRAHVSSGAYNAHGNVSAASYRFPFNDRRFNVAMLGSVFTHMLPDEVRQYVREIARILTVGGFAVISCFLLNDENRASVEAGRSFMTFGIAHPSGVCRLHSASVPEAAVAFDEAFMRRLFDDAGLRVHDVRRGRWWSGEAHDQDVLTVGPSTTPFR